MAVKNAKKKPTIYKCHAANAKKKPTYKFYFLKKQYQRAKKADAQELMEDLYRDYLNNIGQGCPVNETIGNAIQKWLPTTRMFIQPTTYDRKDGIVRNHIVPLLGHIQIFTLTRSDIEKALFTMSDHQGYSHSTCKQMRDCLHQFYTANNFLENMRYNPFNGLRIPINAADCLKKLKYFTHDEMQTICRESMRTDAKGALLYRWGPAICIIAQSGIRSGEMVGLTWQCVNFKERTFEIRMTRQMVVNRETHGPKDPKRKTISKPPKTTNGVRTLYMTDAAGEAFQELKKLAGNHEYVLPNRKNGSVDTSALRKTMRRILDNLIKQGHDEFKNKLYGPHALRHGFATYMINEERAPITVVSQWLGHASLNITVDTYVHVSEKDMCSLAQKIDI